MFRIRREQVEMPFELEEIIRQKFGPQIKIKSFRLDVDGDAQFGFKLKGRLPLNKEDSFELAHFRNQLSNLGFKLTEKPSKLKKNKFHLAIVPFQYRPNSDTKIIFMGFEGYQVPKGATTIGELKDARYSMKFSKHYDWFLNEVLIGDDELISNFSEDDFNFRIDMRDKRTLALNVQNYQNNNNNNNIIFEEQPRKQNFSSQNFFSPLMLIEKPQTSVLTKEQMVLEKYIKLIPMEFKKKMIIAKSPEYLKQLQILDLETPISFDKIVTPVYFNPNYKQILDLNDVLFLLDDAQVKGQTFITNPYNSDERYDVSDLNGFFKHIDVLTLDQLNELEKSCSFGHTG